MDKNIKVGLQTIVACVVISIADGLLANVTIDNFILSGVVFLCIYVITGDKA